MPNQREITVILLMAGKGSRMGCKEKKQFLPFQGKPLYYSALQKFCSWDRCKEILLILSKEDKERVEGELAEWQEERIAISLIEGGAERYWSVYSALEFLKNRESNREKHREEHREEQEIEHGKSKNLQTELSIFIHDGARPCFSLDLCERIYQARKSYGAVIPGLPVTDTIKRVEKGIVQESVDRSSLYRIQTPQAFSFSLLWEAYNTFLEKKEEGLSITDDAMMVEAFTKEQPYLVLGEEQNQKITVPEDLLYLKFLEEHPKK